MRLLFGNRLFEFSDFFALFIAGEIDFSKLNFEEAVKSIEYAKKHVPVVFEQ